MRAVNYTLTDLGVKAALKEREGETKPWKLFDAGGLFLRVSPTQRGKPTTTWCYAYTSPLTGKRAEVTFGLFPAVSIAAVRRLHDEAREQVAAGACPAALKRAARDEQRAAANAIAVKSTIPTFRDFVVDVYIPEVMGDRKPGYVAARLAALEAYVFPFIGTMPLDEIAAEHVFPALKKMQSLDIPVQSVKTRAFVEGVFDHAKIELLGRGVKMGENPARAFSRMFKPKAAQNHRHTDGAGIGKMWRDLLALEGGSVDPAAISATKLIVMTWLRKNEACSLKWRNVDFEAGIITVDKAAMKMGVDHKVPMSTQVRVILENVRAGSIAMGRACAQDDYVFKAQYRSAASRVNGSTINLMLKTHLAAPVSPHGLRSTGATLMEGRGADPALIELCLAHSKKGIVAVYQRHGRLEERRAVMQEYADAVEALAALAAAKCQDSEPVEPAAAIEEAAQ